MMTIRELAKSLGLSKTTVADALNDKSVVRAATRARVRAKAAELGYRPNPAASGFLRQIRSRRRTAYRGNLAYLASTTPEALSAGNHAQRLFHQGAGTRAAALGYGFETIFITGRGLSGRRLGDILASRGVLGVIVGPLPGESGHVDIDWSRVAAVTPGFSVRNPRLPRIAHNCAHAIDTIMEVCRLRGLRRVGLALTEESDIRLERAWSGAMLARQRVLPADERVEPLILAKSAWTAKARDAWLSREKPDALVVCHRADWIAAPRKRSPRPLVVALDRPSDDVGAGIDQRHALCGAMAVDLLSTRILHNEIGLNANPTTVLVEGVWRDPAV